MAAITIGSNTSIVTNSSYYQAAQYPGAITLGTIISTNNAPTPIMSFDNNAIPLAGYVNGVTGDATIHSMLFGLGAYDHDQYQATTNMSLYSPSSHLHSQYAYISDTSLYQQLSNTSGITLNAFPSANTTKFAGTGVSATGASITLNSNGLRISINPGGGTAPAGALGIQGSGTYVQDIGTVQFANSNDVTFGLTENVMTASFSQSTHAHPYINTSNSSLFQSAGAYITTAALSNHTHSDLYVNTSKEANFFLTANSSLLQPSGAYLTTAANSTHTHSQYQSTGAYLTTAAQSGHTHGSGPSISGSISVTSNSNAWSISIPAFITTAAQSGHTHGSAPSITGGISVTSGSNAWSLAVGAYITTAMVSDAGTRFVNLGSTTASTAGSELKITAGSAGLNFGVPKWITTYAPGNMALKGSGSFTQSTGTIEFYASNNITFGLSDGSMTASVNAAATNHTHSQYVNNSETSAYLLTNQSSDFAAASATSAYAGRGTTTASTSGTDLKMTLGTNGLSMGVPKWVTNAGVGGGIALQGSGSFTQDAGTIRFEASNNITFGLTQDSMTASVNAAATNHTHSNLYINTSVEGNFFLTANSSLLQPSGAYLTTAAQSGHTHGAPSITGAVSITSNNTGWSISIPGFYSATSQLSATFAQTANVMLTGERNNYQFTSNSSNNTSVYQALSATTKFAGLGTTFNGANLSGSMTLNSNGLAMSMSAAAPGGGGGIAASIGGNSTSAGAGYSNITSGTMHMMGGANITLSQNGNSISILGATANGPASIVFNDSNGITFGSAGAGSTTTITASHNGLTTAALSDHSHGNPTLYLTNLTGTTASASNGLSLSLSAAAPGGGATKTLSWYENIPFLPVTQTMTVSSRTHVVFPFQICETISFNYVRLLLSQGPAVSTTMGTTANTSMTASAANTLYVQLYSQGVGGNSKSLQQIGSTWLEYNKASFSFTADAVNGSHYTLSAWHTFPSLSGGAAINKSTNHALTVTNINISYAYSSALTGAKVVDVPFASSLSPGIYWMMLGESRTSNTNVAAATRLLSISGNISLIVASQPNNAYGVLGVATAVSSGYPVGAGIWTTNAQGTTGSIRLVDISSSASHNRPYFQMWREA